MPNINIVSSNLIIQSLYNVKQKIADSPLFDKQSIVHNIAVATLKEMAISVGMTAITCCFVASPAIPSLLIGTITILFINLFFRVAIAYLKNKTSQMPDCNRKQNLEKLLKYSEWMCPTTFSLLDQTTTSVLVHEGGHTLASLLVYQKNHPSIEIFPWEGGVTKFNAGILTEFGRFLGEKNARLLTIAAGPASQIILATLQIAFAHKLKEKYPTISKTLLVAGIHNIAQEVLYALSALLSSQKSLGHDFNNLWTLGGIHPVAAVIAMVALPILVKGILHALRK